MANLLYYFSGLSGSMETRKPREEFSQGVEACRVLACTARFVEKAIPRPPSLGEFFPGPAQLAKEIPESGVKVRSV
jgi:hypothetical protein